ncbi:hypothetical protein IFM89_019658 [Coptis chinensis]|uniref:Uncharacterized protein n=1 Tax=Coptis chinensis TaxID=261450 RepID=A0A835I6A8_9MAGN|nr:hypothetical protein IFM89_019658 [Coptis chinensis]
MEKVPSLVSLCIEAVSTQIINGNHHYYDLENIFELPSELFDSLITKLPALGLHKLQQHTSLSTHCNGPSNDGFKNGRKRGRCHMMMISIWHGRGYLISRWPERARQIYPADQLTTQGVVGFEQMSCSSEWHQMYWESHLQECLDHVSEKAVLPSFDGRIGEIAIPGSIMEGIGHKMCMCGSTCDYSKLHYHCQEYVCYARCLRLQNVLCVSETCDLLKGSKLHSLVLRRIKSQEHSKAHWLSYLALGSRLNQASCANVSLGSVNGVCNLLRQNSETLSVLDFIYCKLPSSAWHAICDSLSTRGLLTHGIKNFSVKASHILENHEVSLPSGFLSFLSSGRDDKVAISYIRGNNLQKEDISSLKHCLLHMPKLERLDISDNPIEDNGIRNLVPYFEEILERDLLLFDLKIENCNLSCNGVSELLRSLSQLKHLKVFQLPIMTLEGLILSFILLCQYFYSSEVAIPLAELLGESCLRVLSIEDIELGSSGFLELSKELPEKVKLMEINISKNRGGIEAASFVSKLISRSPELVTLNAGYNFMPSESLVAICSVLQLSTGKLQRLDLTGNGGCYQPTHASMLAEFNVHGRPIVILPSVPVLVTPHDDDP